MSKSQSQDSSGQISLRSYLKVALLSTVVSSMLVFVYVLFCSLHLYDATSELAKNVVMANLGLARKVCQQFFLYICLLQFASLAPSAAVVSAAICCLTLRTVRERQKETGFTLCLSLIPAPLVVLAVVSFSPKFQPPFDPVMWRTYYLPVARSKMVVPLLQTLPYKGMDSAKLTTVLGYPDDESAPADAARSFRYSISKDNTEWLYFYFDEHQKVVNAEIKAYSKGLFDIMD